MSALVAEASASTTPVPLPAPLDGEWVDPERSTFVARRRVIQAAEALDRLLAMALSDASEEDLARVHSKGCAALHDALAFISRAHVDAARGGAR